MFTAGRRAAAALSAALIAGTMALTGCGGDDSSGGKTLTLWHYEGPDSAMGVAWSEAIKEFEATHPGVKVKFEEKGFEQIQKTAPMVLNSRDAPDILEYNKGNATTGLLSKQGLLTDMSDEVAKRGWDKMLSPSLQTTARYDQRGVMGSGNWYGIPNYAEFVMVYYNKDLFAKHGVKVPTTLDEFTAAMETFVKAGVTPLAVGGKEYPAQQILYQLALSKADRGWVNAFQMYDGKVDFHDEAWTHGATTFADWVKRGYIAKNSAGIDAESMGTSFISGKFPIMVSGSWWYGRVAAEVKNFEWGTFLWPGNTMSAGSSGNLWVIPENSENKDLAYDFIDITMQKKIQNKLGNSGGVPVAADPAAITDPKSKELIENFTTLSGNDGLAFYPDWPAPGYYDVLVSGVQKLINGTASSDQVLDEIAKPYQEHAGTIGE
ncbi:ABC transporter substrate-binding protein [Micromonospora deserti]|uniref:Sugar ABC transporter substrate-binding protein n=1 Tax=Micromonospora deserti TaxID=2070366 RepID=A0A2W2CV90_9ACTN|nr:extracellular solute-binding protein [Micromonospora deserti]PZG01791.1 sugar ABC transporter substrate-binding protein [Micromonospora deserti]